MQKILLDGACLKPHVPDIFVRWASPEIEDIGPIRLEHDVLAEYAPKHPERTLWRAKDFFTHLFTQGLLRRTLGFDEGRGLIARGVLPLWFPSTHLLLWRSVAIDVHGNMCVPWLQNIRGQSAVIQWWWLEYDLYASHKTFLFDEKLLRHFSTSAL